MKTKILSLFLCIALLIAPVTTLSSCDLIGIEKDTTIESGGDTTPPAQGHEHTDDDGNEICDACQESVIVILDFYVLNDLHGKFCDTPMQGGVDELATYLNNAKITDDNVILLSSGDMWQGSAESNLTGGLLLTEWMNEMDFSAMTLGNHEYDWGEDAIRENLEVAEFPFLAINVYDRTTGTRAEYCAPSVMVERDGIQIGIIGAIGDCYSSVSSDMVEDVEFKVGEDLTALVKAESERLRDAGADLIVYSLHDGSGKSSSGVQNVSAYSMSAYYDVALSDGYVDLVFEAHSHQSYTLIDTHSVYHLQGGGENRGVSHAEIGINSVNGDKKVTKAEIVRPAAYADLEDDPATEALEDKYRETIDRAYRVLGRLDRSYSSRELGDIAATLYLEAGLEKWGEAYDIVLGGGYLVTRSPYDLAGGECSYAELLSLFPFNNRLTLCSISGSKLKSKFLETGNSNYHIGLSEYGKSIQNNVSYSETYYIVVDTYTALYAPNGLTVVEYYDETTYARDLLAEAIKEGRFSTDHTDYTLTSIPKALERGEALGRGESTEEYYYVKGVVTGSIHPTYGNLYLSDGDGNSIYVYGLYDLSGNRYDGMAEQPKPGDEIVLYAPITKYAPRDGEPIIELKNAILIENLTIK